MDARQKSQFVRNFCNSVRDAVVKQVAAMPEEWDGIELREVVAEAFARESVMRNAYSKAQYRARLRAYYRVRHATWPYYA